jgi:hypothetical protein
MTLIRKLALALCLVLLFSSYSNAQTDPTTGNLINFTGSPTDTTSNWNNGVYVNSLTCWQPGGPGNCGPNPNVQTNGTINFSYGQVDLHQIVNINAGLASVGSGVRLSGFNFGFTAKNGNGWDNGQQDYLSAYVGIYNTAGQKVENYDYTQYTNRKYNWTNFNFSETFANSYVPSTLSTARVGFIGRDTNGWAGPYGPEITNVNFALKYTVKADPCVSDPLFSPSCPGYATAYIKNQLLGSVVASASAPTQTGTATSPTTQSNGASDSNNTSQAPQSQSTSQGQTPQQGQQSAQQSQGQDPAQNPAVAQADPAQPSTPGGPLTSGSPAPAGSPPQQANASSNSSGPAKAEAGPKMGASQLMSIVKNAQEKDKATQQMAVQNAAKIVEGSTQQSQATASSAIASLNDMSANSATAAAQFSSQTTQASVQAAVQSTQPQQAIQSTNTQLQQSSRAGQQSQQFIFSIQQDAQSTGVEMMKPPTTTMIDNTAQASSGNGLTITRNNSFGFNLFNPLNTSISQPIQQSAPVMQFRNETKMIEIETPPMQQASFGSSRAGNPLSDIMQQRFEQMQNNVEQRSDTVKKDVQSNELAGGVDIASMALQPKGFEAYSLVIKDAAFYEPKEVYRGQTVVDNVRALRQMSSDRLHKAMVDSQYKQGE